VAKDGGEQIIYLTVKANYSYGDSVRLSLTSLLIVALKKYQQLQTKTVANVYTFVKNPQINLFNIYRKVINV